MELSPARRDGVIEAMKRYDAPDQYASCRHAAGNWISESHGSHFEEDGIFYSTMEIQSFAELPETLYLEVNAIDGPSLGRIECKVTETDAPVVTAPHLNGF